MAKYINADTLIDELKDAFDDGEGIAIGEYWSSKVVRSVIDDLAQDIDVVEVERIGDTLRVEYKDQAEIDRVMLTDGVWCSLYYLDGESEPIPTWRGNMKGLIPYQDEAKE